MDKEPNKKPEDMEDEEREITVNCMPLTILVSGFVNSFDLFSWIFKAAEVLVVFFLTYQIIGKVLFMALIVSPIIVIYVERCMECYDVLCNGDEWDNDDSSGDDDAGFGDHWNNLTKK